MVSSYRGGDHHHGDASGCDGYQSGDTLWGIRWITPITFNSTGTYQVMLSMSTETPIDDGLGSFIVDMTGTITVQVGRFSDTHGHNFEGAIEWLADQRITKGCNPPDNTKFCPDDNVTRGQMAGFLVRAIGYDDDGGGGFFTDTVGHIFETAVDRLATAGVTKGCNPPANDNFCPDDNVTRGTPRDPHITALMGG